MKKYKIVVMHYGNIVKEFETDSFEEAQEFYFRTGFQLDIYTGLYIDGKLLRIPEAESVMDPDCTYRKRILSIHNDKYFIK